MPAEIAAPEFAVVPGRPRLAGLVVFSTAGIAAGVAAGWLLSRSGASPSEIALTVITGWAFIGVGVFVSTRYPQRTTARLLLATGFAWYIGSLAGTRVPAVIFIAFWLWMTPLPLLVHLVLTFPSGWLNGKAEQAAVGVAWGLVLIGGLAAALTYDPLVYWGCDCPRPGPFPPVLENRDASTIIAQVRTLVLALVAVGVAVLLIRRWVTGSPSIRRTLFPIWFAGAVVVLASVAPVAGWIVIPDRVFEGVGFDALGWMVDIGLLLTPFAFLFGFLRLRLDSAGVGRLAVDLASSPRPGQVRDVLARTMRDPDLRVAFWTRDGSGYVDPSGLAVDPGDLAPGKMLTHISADGEPLAVLIHDAALVDQSELIDAVAAVARLALENERLHAEVLAQLAEVRASRARIVEAADEERRRVERNLHDGAQQRLVALSLILGQAQSLMDQPDSELATALADASEELRRALGELRELARGIHPTLLTEDGLVAATESLAERSLIPVVVSSNSTDRLSPNIEATGYFVVAEALANVAKHASATRASVSLTRVDGSLRVEVRDDGRGGADPATGSGLRGLDDRVAAVGGTLVVESEPGGGTTVVAVLPCG